MSHLRRVCFLVGMSALLIIAPAAAPHAQGPVIDENPKLRDAKVYASDWGLDLQEAIRRLDLQDPAGELEAALRRSESETFAGLWIQHAPDHRVVVRFTRNGQEKIQKYVAGGPLADIVEVHDAKVSLADLEAAQRAADITVVRLGVPANSQVNVFENRVELYVTDQGQLETALEKAGARLPDSVQVIVVPKLMTLATDIYGGLALPDCTSGFGVQNGSGTKGITTAGHCSNAQSYSGTNLPFQAELDANEYDIQWHTAPGFTVWNLIWDGTYNRYIFSTKHRDSQVVGELVCKYGKTTGYNCGYITTKTAWGGDGHTETFIRVHKEGVDLCNGGDSGGPWFYNNTAYGTMLGELFDDAFYMAANYIQGLGVTVLTQ